MEHRLEAKTKAPDFHGVLSLDAVKQCSQSSPIIGAEHCIVVGVQRRTLEAKYNTGLNSQLRAVTRYTTHVLCSDTARFFNLEANWPTVLSKGGQLARKWGPLKINTQKGKFAYFLLYSCTAFCDTNLSKLYFKSTQF